MVCYFRDVSGAAGFTESRSSSSVGMDARNRTSSSEISARPSYCPSWLHALTTSNELSPASPREDFVTKTRKRESTTKEPKDPEQEETETTEVMFLRVLCYLLFDFRLCPLRLLCDRATRHPRRNHVSSSFVFSIFRAFVIRLRFPPRGKPALRLD